MDTIDLIYKVDTAAEHLHVWIHFTRISEQLRYAYFFPQKTKEKKTHAYLMLDLQLLKTFPGATNYLKSKYFVESGFLFIILHSCL